jgi:hypothetical protein
MSKKFPAIRYHGNKEAAVRHTKRGMLELFKTEELHGRMGVKTFARTVEVSPYTSIRTVITPKQTFIHITSNPPEVPEQIPIEEEPEEFDYARCPSAFIIRSIPLEYVLLTDHVQEGYVIAFDHASQKWRVASYRAPTGETVPQAGNLGWYHLQRERRTGAYSPCDVVTWDGQPSPTFTPPFFMGHYDAGDQDIYKQTVLTRFVYFQGLRYNTPRETVGACILEAKDDEGVLHDYMYLQCVVLGNTDDGVDTGDAYSCYDRFYRLPLSELTTDTIWSDWEDVASVGAASFVDELTFSPIHVEFYAPRSCCYVDKDGFSYTIREYSRNQEPNQPISTSHQGCSALIKYNMRDGTSEVLTSSEIAAPTFLVDYNEDESGRNWSGGATATNSGGPWIFYVFPGTQDLYTLGLTHNMQCNANEVNPDGPSDIWGAESYNVALDLVFFKNLEQIDRIPFGKSSCAQSWLDPLDGPSGITWSDAICEEYGMWIYEYHPEIPNSMSYLESVVSYNDAPGYFNITWVHEGEHELISSLDVPAYHPTTGTPTRPTDFTESYAKSWVEGTTSEEKKIAYSTWPVSTWENSTIEFGTSFSFQLGDTLMFNSYYGSALHYPVVGLGNEEWRFLYTGIYAPHQASREATQLWGGALNFVAKKIADGSDANSMFLANSYAIHREVNGEKPYLWLRRKLYRSTTLLNEGHPNPAYRIAVYQIVTSDVDPGTEADSTDNIYNDASSYERETWVFWTKPLGSYYDLVDDPDYEEIPHWNDEEFYLDSNFITEKHLNAITKESGGAFFRIGII